MACGIALLAYAERVDADRGASKRLSVRTPALTCHDLNASSRHFLAAPARYWLRSELSARG
jgi:hypothetical protein